MTDGFREGGTGRPAALARVVVTSAVLLFAQLVVIRWTGSEIPRLAFFKNLVLIGAFLGGGLGLAQAARRPRLPGIVPPLLGLLAVGVPLVGRSAWIRSLRFGGVSEFHWELDAARSLLGSAAFLAFFLGLFLFSVLLFAGFGVLVGRALAPLPALTGYVANLAGSLAGIAAFAAVSFLQLPPPAWLLLLAPPLGWCLAEGRRAWLPALAVAGAALVAGALSEGATWSLYSRILVREGFPAKDPTTRVYQLDVDRAYFMTMLDLSETTRSRGLFASPRRHYDLPYAFAAPKRVLVLGAGGGNDVAAALRAGAEHVDAVEIDPAIVAFGRRLHPERPYDSPRVTVVVDDARSFLRRTRETWDLVVLGLLDSHTLLAGLPGIRLDNFVYTEESLRSARSRLAPGGVFVLSFAVPKERPWMARKLETLVGTAFGARPLVLDVGYDVSVAYLAGDGLETARARAAARDWEAAARPRADLASADAGSGVDVPTDDWPHLYLKGRGVPGAQVLLLVLLALASLALAARWGGLSGAPDLHFALLGAGFLLVETKGVADLGLLFGGTWWTVTATFAGVLVMALLSALAVASRRPERLGPAYAGLVAALATGILVRPGTLLELPLPAAQAAGTLLVALPVFFSGIVFSTSFSRAKEPARALGWNLLGAVAGGLLEYASLAWGVRALGAVAIALYGLSALALRRAR